MRRYGGEGGNGLTGTVFIRRSLRAPAYLSPGIAPDVVAMPVGQGHTEYTRYATGRGQNPVTLLAPLTEPSTGTAAWAATRVRIARAADADGSLILFAGSQRLELFSLLSDLRFLLADLLGLFFQRLAEATGQRNKNQ